MVGAAVRRSPVGAAAVIHCRCGRNPGPRHWRRHRNIQRRGRGDPTAAPFPRLRPSGGRVAARPPAEPPRRRRLLSGLQILARREPRVPRPGGNAGDQLGMDAHRAGRAGEARGPSGHREFLRGDGCSAHPGTCFRARRRSNRRGPRGRLEPCAVARPVLGRPDHRWPVHGSRRPSVHGRGRDAEGVRLPSWRPALDTPRAGGGGGNRGEWRGAVDDRPGPREGQGASRAGARGDDRPAGPLPARHSGAAAGSSQAPRRSRGLRRRAHAVVRFSLWPRASRALHAPGSGRPRPSDRLCQRGWPPARTNHGAEPGDGCPAGPRSEPGAAGPRALGGEPPPGRLRRGRRPPGRQDRRSAARPARARGHTASPGRRGRCAGLRLRARCVRSHRGALRPGTYAPGPSGLPRGDAPRGLTHRGRRPRPVPPDPGRRPGGDRPRPAGGTS